MFTYMATYTCIYVMCRDPHSWTGWCGVVDPGSPCACTVASPAAAGAGVGAKAGWANGVVMWQLCCGVI